LRLGVVVEERRKVDDLRVFGSFFQISIVSSLPFSESWYWYLKRSPPAPA
jgi:hypothetical protein